jgi:hypothetical protein
MKTQDLWIMERARVLRHLHSPILRRKVLNLPTHNFAGEVYVHQGDLEALLSPQLFRNLTAGVSTLIIDEDVYDMENQLDRADYYGKY